MFFADTIGLTIEISTKELQSLKKKVNFYVDHYTLIKKNRENTIPYEDKLNFLFNLNKVLDTEIGKRT